MQCYYCEHAQSTDMSAVDHEFAAAFQGIIHSHMLMPRHQADALMRGAFARLVWQMRLSTTLQIGNARMIDRWLERQGLDSPPGAPPPFPHDLAELLTEIEGPAGL